MYRLFVLFQIIRALSLCLGRDHVHSVCYRIQFIYIFFIRQHASIFILSFYCKNCTFISKMLALFCIFMVVHKSHTKIKQHYSDSLHLNIVTTVVQPYAS